jgi:hypothetical protein
VLIPSLLIALAYGVKENECLRKVSLIIENNEKYKFDI